MCLKFAWINSRKKKKTELSDSQSLITLAAAELNCSPQKMNTYSFEITCASYRQYYFFSNKLHVTLKTSIVFPNNIVSSSILKTGTQFKWLSSSFDLTCLVFYSIKKRKLFLPPWSQNIGTTEDARSIRGRDFRCVTSSADWHNAPPIGQRAECRRSSPWMSLPENFRGDWRNRLDCLRVPQYTTPSATAMCIHYEGSPGSGLDIYQKTTSH